MKTVCLYFEIHQNIHLKRYRFFDIGTDHYYYDDYENERSISETAEHSYIPALKALIEMAHRYGDYFKCAFSLSGTAIELLEQYSPEVLELLDELNASSEERSRKIEMYSFAVHEINEAKLKADEDALLSEEEGRLSSYEKLASDIDVITNMLSDNETSAVSILKQVRRDASHALEMDKTLSDLDSRVESAFYEVSDIAEEFSAYKGKLVYDPARLAEVQDRLSLIYNLKKKYASSQSAPLSEIS